MSYKHGTYAEIIATQDQLSPDGVETLPVYIGTSKSGTSNVPVLVNSYEEAVAAFGYDDDWDKYTLCEAMYAHFKNSISPIGPIVLISAGDDTADATDIVTSIAEVDKIYNATGRIPTLLLAPGWSFNATVYTALVSKCSSKINGKWIANAIVDLDSVLSDTVVKALAEKVTKVFDSKYAKVCYPKVKYGDKIFWLSTLVAVRMQQTDYANDNVPYVSPSNKAIMCSGAVLDDVTNTVLSFDEVTANSMNEKGITTVNYAVGVWRL
jgi:hypothetical protein